MKKYAWLISFVLVCMVPSLLISIISESDRTTELSQESYKTDFNNISVISVLNGHEIIDMQLDDYVLGVLMGEIPADFESEAQKAQAVAVRTYTLHRLNGPQKHPDADVCTDPSCCQAFMSVSEYYSSGRSEDDLRQLAQAVEETSSNVLMYGGKLIEATYFSCSGGRTEDAVDVWGNSIPYLKSVESPGEEGAKYFTYTVQIPRKQFLAQLGLPNSLLLYADSVDISYTAGGGVDKMEIGDEVFTGVQIRTLLALPSTAFQLAFSDDLITITTKGNGHRVGLSQYGAEAMAVAGKNYEEILMHYYPDTELKKLTPTQLQAIFDKGENL